MCGIIGVTGAKDPLRVLLEGLAMLEYRGYDSAGVPSRRRGRAGVAAAFSGPRGVDRRARRSERRHPGSSAGRHRPHEMGHPRRPDRGERPSHFDCTGSIAVVHNGIIENHRELWAALEAAGHERSSATDTEVIAHLIEAEMASGAGLTEAVRRTIGLLTGDFAIAVVRPPSRTS